MRGAARDLRAWWSGTWAGSSTRASPVRTQSKRHCQHTLLWRYLPCGRGRTQDFQPRAAGRVTRGGMQLFSHLPTAWGQASDWERADAIRCNPATPSKKGGEKQPPRHRKRRGGGEGRKDNHSPRQANCLFPPSLEPGATGGQTPKNRDQVLPAQGTAGQGPLGPPGTSPGDGVPQDPQQAGRRAEPP